MTLNACILMKTTPLQTDAVIEKVKRLKGVRKVFIAYGRYDLVAFVEATGYPGDPEANGRDQFVPGVRSTETLVEA